MNFGDGGKLPVCVEHVNTVNFFDRRQCVRPVLRFACGCYRAGTCLTGTQTWGSHPFVRVYEQQGFMLRLCLPCFVCVAPEEMVLLCLHKRTCTSLAFLALESSVVGRVFCSAVSFTMRVSVLVQFFLLWPCASFFVCLLRVDVLPFRLSRFLHSIDRHVAKDHILKMTGGRCLRFDYFFSLS